MSNSPVTFHDTEQEAMQASSPVWKMGEGGSREIIITSDDRQYVYGDRLLVTHKGVKIYVDIDSEVYINTADDTIQVFKRKDLRDPKEREYLLLLAVKDGEDVHFIWTGVVGRQEAFNYIVQQADALDWSQSRILAETATLKKMISLYRFTKLCIENESVENESGFDPEEYASEADEEEED